MESVYFYFSSSEASITARLQDVFVTQTLWYGKMKVMAGSMLVIKSQLISGFTVHYYSQSLLLADQMHLIIQNLEVKIYAV